MTTPSASPAITSPLLSAEQAGAYIQVNRRTLANWRVLGKGPRYVRSGARALYRLSDLDEWVEAHTFRHSADERERSQGQRTRRVEA